MILSNLSILLRNLREARDRDRDRDVCRPLEETEDSQGGIWGEDGINHEGRIVIRKVVFQTLRDSIIEVIS